MVLVGISVASAFFCCCSFEKPMLLLLLFVPLRNLCHSHPSSQCDHGRRLCCFSLVWYLWETSAPSVFLPLRLNVCYFCLLCSFQKLLLLLPFFFFFWSLRTHCTIHILVLSVTMVFKKNPILYLFIVISLNAFDLALMFLFHVVYMHIYL